MVTDGMPSMTDSYLARIYNQLVIDGAEKASFTDGSVQCAEDFIRLFKSPHQLLFIVERDGVPAMIGWMNDFEGKRAQIHFSIFKKYRGQESVGMCKRLIDYGFSIVGDNGHLFDVMYAILPTKNMVACNFAKKIMEVAAIIPNFCFNFWDNTTSDGLFTYIMRVRNESL